MRGRDISAPHSEEPARPAGGQSDEGSKIIRDPSLRSGLAIMEKTLRLLIYIPF